MRSYKVALTNFNVSLVAGGGSPSSPVTINIGSLGARELLRLLVQTNGFNIRRTSRNQPGSDDDADKRDPAGWSTAKRGYKASSWQMYTSATQYTY